MLRGAIEARRCVYESCRILLEKELGAVPSPETQAAYRELSGA